MASDSRGLASGLSVSLNIRNLLASLRLHEQITGWYASRAGAPLPGGPGLGLMIYSVLTRQCPRRNGPNRIIGQSRFVGKSRPILRVARSFDSSSSADPPRDSPERKASHSGAWSPTATGRAHETRPEEHQSDYADYLHKGRASGLFEQCKAIQATTEFKYRRPENARL